MTTLLKIYFDIYQYHWNQKGLFSQQRMYNESSVEMQKALDYKK